MSYTRRDEPPTYDGAVLTAAAHVHSLSSPARAQRVQRHSRSAASASDSGSTSSDEYTGESSKECSSYSDVSTGAVPPHTASPFRDRAASEARPTSRQQSGRLALQWSETETAF